MQFQNTLAPNLPVSAGYSGGQSYCYDDCMEASTIMIEQCCEASVVARIARGNLSYDQEGKINIDEWNGAVLKPYYGDGKMTPSNVTRNRRKSGFSRAFYFLQKHDSVHKSMAACNDEMDRSRLLTDLTRQLWTFADGLLLSHVTQSANAANLGCSDCMDAGGRDIGTAAAPFVIDTSGDIEVAAKRFKKFLIAMAARGDDVGEHCIERKAIFLNSCYRYLMDYLNDSGKECCTEGEGLLDILRPTDAGIRGLDVYFHSTFPIGIAYGTYYGDMALDILPVITRYGAQAADSSAVYDHFYFALRGAHIRNDRTWAGYLAIT